MKIMQYGLQRSGTNFTESILKKNYRIRLLNNNVDRSSPTQKHCRLYENKELIPEPSYRNEISVKTAQELECLFKVIPDYYLVISKDPYSWFLSYTSWGNKCNWPKVEHSYIQEYNEYYKKFMDLSETSSKFIFIKYIDLLSDPETLVNGLAETMGLTKRFFSGRSIINPATVPMSQLFSDEKKKYYIEEQYLKEYDAKSISKLNGLIDLNVMSFLGYELKSI